ncbi:MAG TPA: Ig-like domain-containing protein [Longimicrobium sp.]
MPLRKTILPALALLALAAGCDSPTSSGPGAPAALDIVSGDLQTQTVGRELTGQLVVRVTDDKGRAVRGQIVNFRVTAGGGTVFAGAALTDDDGQARERWTLGTVAGDTQRVEARAVDPTSGQALVFAAFRAVGRPDVPAAVSAVGASSFTGLPALPLADSVAVFVRDVYGNPVPGQTVVWTVKAGGGSASPASSVTGASGVARTRWTLGPQFEGVQVLEAGVGLTLSTQFTANAQLPAGAVVVKVSGDGQSGTAGQVLDAPLVVRVQRADGTPIAGIPVTFTLPAGYGSVSPATGVSDADGRVSVRWTLGTFTGGMEVAAAIATGSSVTFTATSGPGAAASLQKVSGDGQQGRAGSVLADSLVVRAVDVYGNPVPGATVTWSAPSGSASPATVVTGADGKAATAYTLPTSAGAVTVQASAAGAGTASFGVLSVSSPVYMRILQPTPNSVRGDAVQVVVAIDSANASIASVQASAGGRSVALQPGAPGTVTGTLQLADTEVGPMELQVRATTVNGDTATVSVTFIHDAPPTLSVTAPVRNTVARPSLRIDAECEDDAGACTSVTVHAFPESAGMTLIASGTTGVHTSVSLAAWDGEMVLLRFTGTDSRNQTRITTDTVYVEGSAALTDVASAGARLLDADVGRVLYADSLGSVWMRAGSTETQLAPGVHPRIARLHPGGAIFGEGRVYDWNGTLHDVGPLNRQLDVAGSWAIWSNFTNLYRRNLATGATALVTDNAINDNNDVTAAGLVVYASGQDGNEADSYEIYRYDGLATRLTSDPDGTYWNVYPVTDGTNVLYVKRHPVTSQDRVALWRAGTETVLTGPLANLAPGRNYAASGGWIAWTDRDAGGIRQIHTRSPDGTNRMATAAGTPSEIRALGADGTVIYANGGWLYAIRAPYSGAAVKIASDWGSNNAARFVGGELLLFLGRSVFRANY